MNRTVTERPTRLYAGILLAVAGAVLIVRYGLITSTDWPHWLHHVIHAAAAWPMAIGAWLLAAPGRRMPRIAAALFAVWAVGETVVGVAAFAWETMLHQAEMPAGLHTVEYVLYLAYLGDLLLGIHLIRRSGIPRVAGAVLSATLLIDFAGVPWAAGAGIAVAGALLAATARRTLHKQPTTVT